MAFKITKVYKNTPADKAGFSAGDTLTHLGGEPLKDNIDFLYFSANQVVPYTIKKPDGRIVFGELKKKDYEELGIEFEGDGFGKKRSCCNNCMFCFVDQLPKNMRETLYFKDDDWRMSFVMGNYVTLSNVTDKEFERILRRKVSPLYISVHATDPEVRKNLIRNQKIFDILPRLKRLYENKQRFNCQAVLCPGINDGTVLEKTISDLYSLKPYASSFAVVPVGLTKHRNGLCNLEIYTKEEARAVIKIVEKWQKKSLEESKTRFVFASDEFYLRAELPFPSYEEYEEFEQLEDGVGLTAMLIHDVNMAIDMADSKAVEPGRKLSFACGVDIASTLVGIAKKCEEKFGVKINVYPIVNDFFGHTVTVSGLITGGDLISQLTGKDLGKRLLISDSMLRDRKNVFLDDITLEQICGILKVDICPISDGYELIDAVIGADERI